MQMCFAGLRKLELDPGFTDRPSLRAQPGHELGMVNLIIGPNGGGKSTVVDLVRCLGGPEILATLIRENLKTRTEAGFRLNFDDGSELQVSFNKMGIDEAGVAAAYLGANRHESYRGLLDVRPGVTMHADLQVVFSAVPVSVFYRNWHDEAGVTTEDWLAPLNDNAPYLNGLGYFPLAEDQPAYPAPPGFPIRNLPPLYERDEFTLSTRFNDDPMQTNHVRKVALPSGWRAFGGLIGWLRTRPTGSLCVVEEPETHMHPTLQRVALREVVRVALERNLQVFLTSHSAVMIDVASSTPTIRLFQANGWKFSSLTERVAALHALGHRPSDLCLANGLVWIEGPSDRLYLLHWLKLWCEEFGRPLPEENIDFAFSNYGGSSLSHYSGIATSELMSIIMINPNAFLIMDRDLDFVTDVNGDDVPNKRDGTKARIRSELSLGGGRNVRTWVTEGYTIESYLPEDFRNRHFEVANERLIVLANRSKTDIARAFAEEFSGFKEAYGTPGLPDLIEALHGAITHWTR